MGRAGGELHSGLPAGRRRYGRMGWTGGAARLSLLFIFSLVAIP